MVNIRNSGSLLLLRRRFFSLVIRVCADASLSRFKPFEIWKNKDPSCPPTSWLKKLLELILYKDVFRFNDKFYIQKQGTAMGTKMAPTYANICMGTLVSRILSETTPSPIHWKRYIDDIF